MKIQACRLSAQYKLNGEMELLVTVDKHSTKEVEAAYDLLKDRNLSVEIKPYKAKRSLDANAYAWTLIEKIAEKLQMSRSDVYRNTIKNDVGVYDVIPIKNEAVARFISVWEKNGIGYQCDTLECVTEGFTTVIAYYGSSSYDTQEMSRLINSLVADAKELGIETLSPRELDLIKGEWK